MVTEVKCRELDNGLRVLARMIARAHLKEMCGKQSEIADCQENAKEESDANKRRI